MLMNPDAAPAPASSRSDAGDASSEVLVRTLRTIDTTTSCKAARSPSGTWVSV